MKLLSAETLGSLPKTVIVPNYSVNDVKASILHFGVGNFHRAHQAVYVDNLMCKGIKNLGIIGVSLRSSKMRDKLIQQDYLYTVATLNTPTTYRVIGSIKNILVAPEDHLGEWLVSPLIVLQPAKLDVESGINFDAVYLWSFLDILKV